MASKPATVAEYLAALPEDRRAVLEAMRQAVLAAAPGTEEGIAYDMPAYRLGGKFVVSFGAFKRHYSLFPASAVVLERLGAEAAGYAKGRGTFQFPADQPLPLDLIARITAVRLEETAAAVAASR